VTLPKSSERPLDPQGYFSLPWRQWLAQVDRRINTNGADAASVAADVAAIATALGSPDGTVANIPDQDSLHAVIYGQNGIQIVGALAGGTVGVVWRGGMSNLTDVDLTGLADTYALKWDAASGTWKPGTAGGVTDGDKGDVVVSGSGAAWAIDTAAVTTAKVADDAITYAKLQNISATSRILGRKTASAGDAEECTLSEVLDFIGSAAQGDILYRGATTWARLPAGSSGTVLTAQGTSAAPVWSTVGAIGAGPGTPVGYAYTASNTSASSNAVIPSDNTIPQNTEGAAYSSLDTTYTPNFATSLLEVTVSIPLVTLSAGGAIMFALFRDSGANAIASARINPSSGNFNEVLAFTTIVSAGSTSATTFKLRYGSNSLSVTAYLLRDSTTIYFGTGLNAVMTVREIKQ